VQERRRAVRGQAGGHVRGQTHVAADTVVSPDQVGLGEGGRSVGRAQPPRPHNGHGRQH